MKGNDLDFSYTLSPAQRHELDELLKTHSPEEIMTSMVDGPINQKIEQKLHADKNSYAFWGPETAKIVRTPETLFLPMSYEAYKISGASELHFKHPSTQMASMELALLATTIAQWAKELNLNEFFLKNANFSSKHRWPHTCNVDFSHTPNMTTEDKISKIISHMCQINSDAMLCWASPGLGWVARKKLDLEPVFYAFGRKFFHFENPRTGDTQTLSTSASDKSEQMIAQWNYKNPDMQLRKTFHIGMPITREIRIFTFGGDIAGYVPYWTPVAFKNQNVYGLADNISLSDALKRMNTFSRSELDYLHNETKKIIQHPKFNDTDWAIDWIITRDNTWYMTDMQIAQQSHMDYDNMIFASNIGQTRVNLFLKQRLESLQQAQKSLSTLDKMVLKLRGSSADINKTLERFGYPSQQRIIELSKQLEQKQK